MKRHLLLSVLAFVLADGLSAQELPDQFKAKVQAELEQQTMGSRVGTKAFLYEERAGEREPAATEGTMTWSVETASGPLSAPVAKATMDFASKGFSVVVTLRGRNKIW